MTVAKFTINSFLYTQSWCFHKMSMHPAVCASEMWLIDKTAMRPECDVAGHCLFLLFCFWVCVKTVSPPLYPPIHPESFSWKVSMFLHFSLNPSAANVEDWIVTCSVCSICENSEKDFQNLHLLMFALLPPQPPPAVCHCTETNGDVNKP